MTTAVAILTILTAQTAPREYAIRVLDCHDADTCNVDIVEPGVSVFAPFDLTHHDTVRFCNVNAPELKGATLEAAKKSRDAVLGWIRAAKVMMLRPAMKNGRAMREKYGRLLGWLIADGANLSERLIAEGLAVGYIECAP